LLICKYVNQLLPLHIVQQFLFHNIVDSYYKSRSADELELKCILLIWFGISKCLIQLAWIARRRYFTWRNNLFMTITMCGLYYGVSVTNDHEYVPFRNHNSVLSPFVTYHRVCNKSNMTVPHVEQELLTIPEHPSSHPVFNGVRVAWSLVFCVMFCRSLFVLFLLAIEWSVLRFTASD